MRYIITSLIVLFVVALGWWRLSGTYPILTSQDDTKETLTLPSDESHPLSIARLRSTDYPGSDITVVEELAQGSNYSRARVRYTSEGNTIYALMTIPTGDKPSTGWPTIVFNHGYIPPAEYRTTEKYVAYQDGFAKNGYITFKSDYRGHGQSEGSAEGGYGSPAYTTDVLNALSSLKQHPDVDRERIGMWGHSMGGYITLRTMVAEQDIKAAVIWAGVVGSYPDLISNWRRTSPPPSIPQSARRWRQALQDRYGTPEQNPQFWDSISATAYLTDVSGPIQLHHGTADVSVPVAFSEELATRLQDVGKEVEIYTYPGDDHNLSRNFAAAMTRSIAFFDRYVK